MKNNIAILTKLNRMSIHMSPLQNKARGKQTFTSSGK